MASTMQSIVVFSALISLSFVGASRPVTVSSIVAPRSRLEVDQLAKGCSADLSSNGISREAFPKDFEFGTSSAAYQIEGSNSADGRGVSTWDVFARLPGKIADGSNADETAKSYLHYGEDIEASALIGMDSYKFSVSWARIQPEGVVGSPINEDAIAYYNKVIDTIVAAGVKPVMSLYNGDLPDNLQWQGGWWNGPIVEHYKAFGILCYQRFGDRVKTFVTFDDIYEEVIGGYLKGYRPPGRCSDTSICNGTANPSTEPYYAAHIILLAHLVTAKEYRLTYQEAMGGVVGITVNADYYYPLTDSAEDKEAAERALIYKLGWFLDPVILGDYPEIMKKNSGSRLEPFLDEQKEKIINSSNFIGINFNKVYYVSATPPPKEGDENPLTDSWTKVHAIAENEVKAEAIYDISLWLTKRYPNKPIYITANGIGLPAKDQATDVCDGERIRYYTAFLSNVLRAIKDGAPIERYYAWTLVDGWSWTRGYLDRWGLFYIDFFQLERTRVPKASAVWFSKVLGGKVASA